MENILKSHDFEKLYTKRFSEKEREAKAKLWKCLVEKCLQRYFGEYSTIIDLGCGFCEFINSVKAKKKYGYDKEPYFKAFAGPDVEFIIAEERRAIPLASASCDRVFASNFFEHLDSREHIRFILEEAFRLLKPAGRIIVIQPNIALTGDAYWDFFDHIVPLSDKSLSEAMELAGFRKILVKRRFLPYSTKKMKMHSSFLLRIYLAWPCIQWVLGKQSLIIAEKPDA